jgi:hypothetical protein
MAEVPAAALPTAMEKKPTEALAPAPAEKLLSSSKGALVASVHTGQRGYGKEPYELPGSPLHSEDMSEDGSAAGQEKEREAYDDGDEGFPAPTLEKEREVYDFLAFLNADDAPHLPARSAYPFHRSRLCFK